MPDSNELTLVTLNTWKCDGQYRVRLKLMVQEIQRADADIVLLQECFVAPDLGYDTAKTIAAALGFHYALWRGREKARACEGREVASTSGVAVLSRFPMSGPKVVNLPCDPKDGERAALLVEIAHPAGALVVGSIHLTHLESAEALRQSQYELAVAELVRMSASHVARPAFLGGDFNAPPDAPEFSRPRDDGAPGLIDVRRLAGVAPSRTVDDEDVCIDHIMVYAHESAAPFDVSDVRTICDTPDPITGILPSDHFGVRAVLKWGSI